jgi:cytochrome c peroxidase
MKVYLTLLIMFVFFIINIGLAVELPKHLSPRAEVGKKIFFEPLFGNKNRYSCNSCHNLEKHCGADSRPVSPGFKVNAPTVFNVANNTIFFWEGLNMTLKGAVRYHIINKNQLNMSERELIKRIKNNPALENKIKSVYKKVDLNAVVDALTHFLKSLTFQTKIDKFLSGNKEVLSKEEYEGYILFKNLGCRDCHSGINFGGERKARSYIGGNKLWRVPSLRFVVCTYPYLHDGSKKNLNRALQYTIENFIGLELEDKDIEKLKKFLKTLGY